jgi:SAM-dependent methyltransferase
MPNEYLLDNAWQQQRARLAGLEAWFDPGTIRHLEALGVAEGWHCWEVGAGGGSIAAWLARRVGPSGHVLATDLDTRFVEEIASSHLTVQRHDILADDPPQAAFDLVHARFVVEHLHERLGALRNMLAALSPGGWLLIEDTDSCSWLPDPTADASAIALFTRWTRAYAAFYEGHETTIYAGRRLYGEYRTLGLDQIGVEGRVFMIQGGSAGAEVWRLTAEQVRDRLVAEGYISAADMQQLLELLSDPDFAWMEGAVVAAWGQK